MEKLTLVRHEAQGNDFVIALLSDQELRDLDTSLDVLGVERSDLARIVCDRDLGVGSRRGYVHSKGADGFVVGVHNAFDGQRAECVRMHLLNADGSFAETSGNGLACLAMASFDARIIGEGPLIPFETDAGTQRCTIGASGTGSLSLPDSNGRFIQVAMRKVEKGPEIPSELYERISSDFGANLRHLDTGDVGNPHLVIALTQPPIDSPVSELSNHAGELGDRIAQLGSVYESYFHGGINVEFIWPFSRNPLRPEQAWTLQMSVWERGAGLTVSCGSGSVVAATLAHRWEFVRIPNDPPPVSAENGDAVPPPSSYLVDMRTAPFPGDNGSGFQYWVRTVPAYHEDFSPPQLGVVAERIETGLTLRLDRLPVLLDDLTARIGAQR
ncbi:hypothetical protein [Candidatus Poriferisodalis sp.]|uniref:hypothetical protein n=1 Tax=Candidatus Poriferisodalis sp. TaxID=3101277 RepID=UPI003B517A93